MSGRIIYTPERTHHRGKSRPSLKVAAISIAIVILMATFMFVFRYPEWQLAKINVSGTQALSSEAIKSFIEEEISGNYAFLIPKRSVFLLKEGDLASKIKGEFPRIQEVSLERHFPDRLTANIVERELWGILCNDNFTPDNQEDIDCVFIDPEGRALDHAPNSSGSLIVKIKTDFSSLSLGEHVLEPSLAKYLKNFGEKIEVGISSKVTVYELSSILLGEFRITLDDGFFLVLARKADVGSVLKVLKTVLDEEVKEKRSRLEYVDLRFGNKVFYKFH